MKKIKPSTAILYALRRYKDHTFLCHILERKAMETGNAGYMDAHAVIQNALRGYATLNRFLVDTCPAYDKLRYIDGNDIWSPACKQARILWFRTLASQLKKKGL